VTERLLALLADRIGFVPRYRQRLRSALPRPGSMEQLRQVTGHLIGRPVGETSRSCAEALEELVESASPTRPTAPRGTRSR
jgi:hypothetical protein